MPRICLESYLILGTGTDIGKTFLVENICHILPTKYSAIKPISSGSKDDDENSDSARILKSLGMESSLENLAKISPWRFEQPISPHLAAQLTNTEIDFLEVKNFCLEKITQAKNENKSLLIEAAGGVMTPINNNKTFLDLAQELQIPVLLITANYLGAISHTLCAIEALKSRKVIIEKIIVNEGLPISVQSSFPLAPSLEKFSGISTISLDRFLQKLS